MDINAILTLALEKGLFAALFVFAFWYILSESKKREESQRALFVNLSDSLEKAKDAIVSIEETTKRVDSNNENISQEVTELKYMITLLDTVIKSKINQQG